MIAEAGATTMDWLLTGRGPSEPIFPGCTVGEPERDWGSEVGSRCTSACVVLELLGRLPEGVLNVEPLHLHAGVAAVYQRQQVLADAWQHHAGVAFELLKAYETGDTTLRPLAALLGVEVDWLHEVLDPG